MAGLDKALEISESGVEAQRRVMELIASNVANLNTTRTIMGGPYRRKVAVLSEKPLSFAAELERAQANYGGVEIADVVEDRTPFPQVYKPEHPDADAQGFLRLPNVNLATEMTDMIYVSKLYEANITVFNSTKKMMLDTLQLP